MTMIPSGGVIYQLRDSTWISHHSHLHGIQVQLINKLKNGTKKNRNQKVWAAQPKQGDSKRFCTLNICFHPSGEQPRPAIIFRGKGLRLSAVEKASWDKDVDVFFQPSAWAD